MNTFTFIVLSYNHSAYILEHLESIKYQVENFGSDYSVDLIISDDCSSDGTKDVIKKWLSKNRILFRNVTTFFNEKNIGTCKSLKNAINVCDSDFCKITGGDDVYSRIDIFDFILENRDSIICTGIPIRLSGEKIHSSFFETFNYFGSRIIYRYTSFKKRLLGLSIINAPNVVYSMEALKNEKVLNCLDLYDVVEDFPLQIAISEIYPDKEFVQTDKNLVYYRRTEGSTFLVANKRFKDDQVKILNYLITDCLKMRKFFTKVILINRLFVFNNQNFLSRNFLNLSKLIYLFSLLIWSWRILIDYFLLRPNLIKDVEHYKFIQEAAKKINE